MKKRILALILAGLLTASVVACAGDGGEEDTTINDEETTVDEDETGDEDGTGDEDEDDEWDTVDETVYTYKTVSLRNEAGGDVIETLDPETVLHRTRVNNSWSYVETEDGVCGYVSNTYITEINILGTDFERVQGGVKTMYSITDGLSIRKYPTANNTVSKIIGTLTNEQAVQVVATNGQWCKINYGEDDDGNTLYYYVSAKYLANEKGGTPDVTPTYDSVFVELTTPKTMYTTVASLRLRSEPVIESGNVLVTLPNAGIQVTVTKTGTVTKDGKSSNWSYVSVTLDPEKPGDPSRTLSGYISSDYLTETGSNLGTSALTLDELLARYPAFTRSEEKLMYVIKGKSLTVRSTPEIISIDAENSNYVDTIATASDALSPTTIKVVAQGSNAGMNWYIIERTESSKTVYRFISASASYTTEDPSGEWKLTLSNLESTYSEFEVLAESRTIVAESLANGYYTPAAAETVPYRVEAGQTATLVAVQTGGDCVWYVIQVNGTLYFVPISSFADIANG